MEDRDQELRQQASRYLREVQRGETIEVTDRGNPVAWLVPVPPSGGLAELAASGRLVAAAGDALDLGPRCSPSEEQRSPASCSPSPVPRNADVAVYLDSSAIVKLVVAEAESDALTGHLRGHPDRVSCASRASR